MVGEGKQKQKRTGKTEEPFTNDEIISGKIRVFFFFFFGIGKHDLVTAENNKIIRVI